jgi:hypothetical protein
MLNQRSRPKLFLSTLLLALATGALLPSAKPLEPQLKAKDHQTLGGNLAAYFEANATKKGLGDSLDDLTKALGKIKKKLKGTDPLSLTEDLEAALWFAQRYDKQKGLKKGRIEEIEAERTPWPLTFALHAPKKYNPKQAYPLILCIADEGKKPADHLIEDWIDAELRNQVILAVVPMPEDMDMWTKRGSRASPGGGGNVRIVYGDITMKYAVDFDRVYLAGWGAGVAAATQIASESPDLFAGVIGRSGDVRDGMPASNFANLHTLFISSGKGATEFEAKAKEAEYETCTLMAEGKESDVLAWVLEKSRISNPERIVFVSGNQYANKAYWIDMPAAEGERRVEASIDRESNTITINGEGTESVTLLFNDLLVDLDKPIKVVCNGVEHLDEIPRNMITTLELMWKVRSDPGKLYVASNTYDLSAAAAD